MRFVLPIGVSLFLITLCFWTSTPFVLPFVYITRVSSSIRIENCINREILVTKRKNKNLPTRTQPETSSFSIYDRYPCRSFLKSNSFEVFFCQGLNSSTCMNYGMRLKTRLDDPLTSAHGMEGVREKEIGTKKEIKILTYSSSFIIILMGGEDCNYKNLSME